MKRFQTILFGFLLAISCAVSAAEPASAYSGHWLVKALEADARVKARQGTDADVIEAMALTGLVGGIIAVHRENNLMATLLYGSLDSAHKKAPDKNPLPADSPEMRVAFAFTPLLGLPDTLQYPQVLAILRRYLAANPERWDERASSLIVAALRDSIQRSDAAKR